MVGTDVLVQFLLLSECNKLPCFVFYFSVFDFFAATAWFINGL
jgi:hypothetical protein